VLISIPCFAGRPTSNSVTILTSSVSHRLFFKAIDNLIYSPILHIVFFDNLNSIVMATVPYSRWNG
jgi:hypothetical protein